MDGAIAAALFVASLLWFSLTWDRHFELRDEGLLFRFGARVAAGEVPHRDFEDAYGPGAHLLTGLGVKLFDGEILAVRRMLALLKAAAVVLTFAIARFVVPRSFALFASLLALAWWGRQAFNLNVPYAALETVPLCLASLWLLLRALARDSRRAYVAAGIAAGAPILFKQSLGLFDAYGLALALCAVSAIESASPRGSRLRTALCAALWAAAGLAVVVALREYLSLREYLLHFIALHLLMGLVAGGVLARGDLGPLRHWLARRLLPFLLGVCVLPAATALVYLGWGALDELLVDMFVLPGQVRNYALPATLPPLAVALGLAGAIGLCSAALLGLGGRPRAALWLAASAAAALAAGSFAPTGELAPLEAAGPEGSALYRLAVVWEAGHLVTGVQSALIALAALACVGPALLRPGRAADGALARCVVPLLFFHTMVSLQSFPRASFNTWIAQGAFAPLLGFVLYRWYRLANATDARRRLAAAALVALVPLWAVGPLVQRALVVGPWELPRAPLNAPRTAGIAVGGVFVREWVDGFRELVPYLMQARPLEAPLFVLSNEGMIYYASGREPLFPEREFRLFLLGWDMLPESYLARLDAGDMIRRLRRTPDAILVDHVGDPAALRLRAALPELAACVDAEFETLREFGSYRVLRRKLR